MVPLGEVLDMSICSPMTLRLLRRGFQLRTLPLVLTLALLPSCARDARPSPPARSIGVAMGRLPTFPAATGTPGETLGAMVVTDPTQLVGGPAATGRVGDVVMYNDVIRVVIDAIDHPTGFAQSGGNIVDADRIPGGNDQLAQVFTYLENAFPRHFVYNKLTITHNGSGGQGSDGQKAEVVVTGVDSRDPSILGVTRYQLEPGQATVKIITDVYNFGPASVRNYEIGDSLQWGLTEHYVPGLGTQVSGRTTTSAWVAGVGEGISYGMGLVASPLAGPHGNGWTDVIGGRATIGRSAYVSYERLFVVGTGDTASITSVLYPLRGDVVEKVTGQVLETGTRAPVMGAKIEARSASGGKPMGFAVSDATGHFTLELPASEYKLVATHRARGAREAVEVDLTSGKAQDVTLQLTPAARLLFRIDELRADGTAGGPMPAKLTFEGLNGTPDPEFGHKAHLPGALNVWFSASGQGEIELPPGTYRVTASRGIEYAIRSQEFTLEAGREQIFAVGLAREVDTGGYLSADFNQHSLNSSNSWVRMEDFITANLAEGVEIVAATDLDYVSDFLPLLQSMGIESRIKVLSGQEISTRNYGGLVVFPMEPRPELPGNGAFLAKDRSPKEIFESLSKEGEARVIQVNQPREGEEGYFNLMQLDPQTAVPVDPRFSFGFNTVEVFSGKRMKDASVVLRDWFLFLNKGYAFTATGNSDSRTLVTQERGYPRNYLGIYSDNPGRVSDSAVVTAVRDTRDVVVTNGPFIRANINGLGRIGSLITVKEEAPGKPPVVRLEVEVQSAGWIPVDELEVVANGEVVRRIPLEKTNNVLKYQGTIELFPTRDTWYVVIARGSVGMEPVVPRYKGTTITPFGFTNPIWVDVDGDGNYQPLFPRDKSESGYVEVPRERVR